MKRKSVPFEEIEKKIAELEKMREEFIVRANEEIASLNGRIAALRSLIEPEEEKDEEKDAD